MVFLSGFPSKCSPGPTLLSVGGQPGRACSALRGRGQGRPDLEVGKPDTASERKGSGVTGRGRWHRRGAVEPLWRRPPDVRGWLSSPVPAAGKSSQGVRRCACRERCSHCEQAAGSRPGQAAASLFQTRRPCARSAFLTRPRTPPQHCDAQVHGIGKRVGRNVRISPQKSRERKPRAHAEVPVCLKNATLSLLCPLAGPFGEEEKSSSQL